MEKIIQKNEFNFFSSLKDLDQFVNTKKISINLSLFGSSLQYIENLEGILRTIKRYNCKYILIDRQPMLMSGKTSYRVQKVPFGVVATHFQLSYIIIKTLLRYLKNIILLYLKCLKGLGMTLKMENI